MSIQQFGLLIVAIVVGTVVVQCATTDRCKEARDQIPELERQRQIAVAMLDFDKSKQIADQIEYWNQKVLDECY